MTEHSADRVECTVRAILALQHWFASVSHRLGILHAMVLEESVDERELLDGLFFKEERPRLSRVIEFTDMFRMNDPLGRQTVKLSPGSSARRSLSEIKCLVVDSDPEACTENSRIQMQFSGGNWYLNPGNTAMMAAVKQALHLLVT